MNNQLSVDRDPATFHRQHTIALPLLVIAGEGGAADIERDLPFYTVKFRLRLPDFRARASLSVFFVPGRDMPDDPADPLYGGYFDAGNEGLSVVSLQSAEEQGSELTPVELIYGQPSAPIPLPGDTFGWVVSAEADGKEWHGILNAAAPTVPLFGAFAEPGGGGGGPPMQSRRPAPPEEIIPGGRWLARATFTAADPMTNEEWKRVCDRLYLRGPAQAQILPAWRVG